MTSVLVEPGKPAVILDIDWSEIEETLSCISFAYPFPDPNIALAHDDNGIANGRMPNRRVNGQIMPGPFYVLRVTSDGRVTGLSQEDAEKYREMFSVPDHFPAGHWTVTTKTRDEPYAFVVEVISDWVEGPVPSSAEYLGSTKPYMKPEKGEES